VNWSSLAFTTAIDVAILVVVGAALTLVIKHRKSLSTMGAAPAVVSIVLGFSIIAGFYAVDLLE